MNQVLVERCGERSDGVANFYGDAKFLIDFSLKCLRSQLTRPTLHVNWFGTSSSSAVKIQLLMQKAIQVKLIGDKTMAKFKSVLGHRPGKRLRLENLNLMAHGFMCLFVVRPEIRLVNIANKELGDFP